MDLNKLQSIFTIGETVAVEFKRCGNGIESDTYETVCSFLNRFGGDIFLGVLDDGTVVGVPEKFVIEKNRMYVENANRAAREGIITVNNLEPNPKNPIIAAFFRNIGYADQPGSGVRNLFKYSKFYSGKEPEFIEGDVFRIVVPLDEEYSYDFGQIYEKDSKNEPIQDKGEPIQGGNEPIQDKNEPIRIGNEPIQSDSVPECQEYKLLTLIKQNAESTRKELALKMNVSLSTVKRLLVRLQEENIIVREGNNRKGRWVIKNDNEHEHHKTNHQKNKRQ